MEKTTSNPDIENSDTDKDTCTVLDIFAKHSVSTNSILEPMHKDLLFLRNAINLIIGESKSGKTYTTIKALVDAGFKEEVIHLDFDRNMDEKLKKLGVKTYPIGDVTELMKELSTNHTSIIDNLVGKILVIDSLQDLSLEDGLDSNNGALKTINKVLGFKSTGATIIVIHHTTVIDDGKKLKVKGNATTITSKCDTTIGFVKVDNSTRYMQVVNTRAEDKISSGTNVEYISEDLKQENSSDVPA